MKIVSNRFAILCAALGLTTFSNYSAHSAVTVDGTKDADYGTPLSIQTVTAGWGGNNTLASMSAVQQGSALYVFLAGRPQGNAFILFIDSKPGGISFVPNNLIGSGGDEYCINNLGSSSSAGMTFENGFEPDYAIRVYGDGSGGTGAWANLYVLTAGSARVFLGNSGAEDAMGAPVTKLRTSWQTVTDVATADMGSEIQLNMAQLGVPSGTGQTVKMMAMLVNGGSDYGSNQVLGSLPDGSGDMGGGMRSLDFNATAGTQTVSVTVDNADMDQDGIPDSQDPDIDGDGLANEYETNTGTFVDATHTGTNPLDADSDDDGVNDGTEVNTNGTNPLKPNYPTLTVAGDFQGWSPSPGADNTMAKVAGQEFGWTLNYRFNALTNVIGKFTIGSWSKNWGANNNTATTGKLAINGGDVAFNVTSTGFWTFAFNTDTLDYTFTKTVFADFAAFATAYGLAGDETADQDNDGITNGVEFTNNTDPTRANDATPPVITLTGDPLVGVVLNGSYTDAGATATDNVDSSVTVNVAGLPIDTSVAGTYTVTYTANDVAGNAAASKTRTVIVYDPATGFASRFTSMTVPGNYTTPVAWDPNGGNGNSMALVGNFKWRLLYDFTSASSVEYKIVGNGVTQGWGSPDKWGQGGVFGAGNNATASVTPGRYAFELDEVLNSASLTRVGDLPPSGLSYTPSSASGTVGTAITSLNPTVTGTVTSYSVSPALPLGLSLDASSGVISGTPSAAASTADYTVTATNGTGTTTAIVTIEVAAAPVGSTFAGAYPGASMTDVAPNGLTFLANYAFGGDATTPATLPVQDTSDPTKLRLIVVFRTDDNSLTLGGQASTGLEAAWSSAGVTVVDGESTGLPANMARKVISVDRGSDPKKFLRATVTK